ncbi:MAG: hypothetical protein U0840_11900 [Gemmataceae bacterium]
MMRIPGPMMLGMLVLWVGLAGCSKPAVREKPLPDPLLTSKKPIEGKPHVTESSYTAAEELPPPPPMPTEPGPSAGQSNLPVVQLLGPQSPR